MEQQQNNDVSRTPSTSATLRAPRMEATAFWSNLQIFLWYFFAFLQWQLNPSFWQDTMKLRALQEQPGVAALLPEHRKRKFDRESSDVIGITDDREGSSTSTVSNPNEKETRKRRITPNSETKEKGSLAKNSMEKNFDKRDSNLTENSDPQRKVPSTLWLFGKCISVNNSEQKNYGEKQSNLIDNRDSQGNVSTDLSLSDECWINRGNSKASTSGRKECLSPKSTAENLERCKTTSNIAIMKMYSEEERKEEKLQGVSTQLKIFNGPYAWDIKKKIRADDFKGVVGVGVSSEIVRARILPSLSEEHVKKVEEEVGIPVTVWDEDTQSRHKLLFMRHPKRKTYLLVGNWKRDFLDRRNLKEGVKVGLRWDRVRLRFIFHVFEVAAIPELNQK